VLGAVSDTLEQVLLTIDDDGVALVTFNRPEAMNALTLQFVDEMLYCAVECDTNPAIRAVVLTGAGKAFSAGGDLKDISSQPDRAVYLKLMTTSYHAALSRFARMSKPVIAAVNGVVAGGGLGQMAAADLAILGESVRISSAFTAAGLTPDSSSTFFVQRHVGHRRALELFVTNRQLSASEALEWGLATQVVPDGDVLATSLALAAQLAGGAIVAFGEVKRLLLESASLETQLEQESRAISASAAGPEGLEGVDAFLTKRRADFRGGGD